MLLPDCRHDDVYNEDFLNDSDMLFLMGFDWCCEMAVDNFFDNHFEEIVDEDPFDDTNYSAPDEDDMEDDEYYNIHDDIDDDDDDDDESIDSFDMLDWFLTKPVQKSDEDEYTMDFSFGDKKEEDRTVDTYADLLRMNMLEWIESRRNELIVSCIEKMDQKEYMMHRASILARAAKGKDSKEYYDTRHYMCTGQKRPSNI